MQLFLYQIAYSEETFLNIEKGYLCLDNRENKRPDWYEYWPIRRFLLDTKLDENAFYGFFSPKFKAKTGLSWIDVDTFIRSNEHDTDVFLFSPQPDMGAFFLNVYEQAETFDPGLMHAYGEFLNHIGLSVPLPNLVMDSRNIVYSNYFVARPAFWREWLRLNELLFEICEGAASPLKEALCSRTSYAGGARRKVFLQERTASLILAVKPSWKSRAYNPFGMGWSMSRFRDYPSEAIMSDALKMAFCEQRFPQYLEAFVAIRKRFIAGAASE